ncbi:MAG: hypothetical protein HY673_07265 [Chloroflexi bacterium]|nr:hypothetical protein [Chloroflexota bacterium]
MIGILILGLILVPLLALMAAAVFDGPKMPKVAGMFAGALVLQVAGMVIGMVVFAVALKYIAF